MVKAYPVNAKGEQDGPVRTFSDMQWEKMVATFKKKFAWRKVEEGENKTADGIREVSLLAEQPAEVAPKDIAPDAGTKGARPRKNKI